MNCENVKALLTNPLFGNQVICLDTVDSTNTYILKLAQDGAPEGTVVTAEYQTSGRGRMDRKWFSEREKNLLFSLLLRPELSIDYVQKITLAVGYYLAESIEAYFKDHDLGPIRIDLKWPNDLLVDGKKVAGILVESILRDKKITALAIGCGVNVNAPLEELPQKVRHNAVSLKELGGKELDREKLMAEFLNRFAEAYERLERTYYHNVVKMWKTRCKQFNQEVLIHTPDGEERAVFMDVNEDGYLIYKNSYGKLKRLVSGEVKCY